MSTLAPNLFDRRYDDLLEMARAQLPALAPAWTDYNAHDPGITLVELLAWVTEAQLYALGRSRRDERLGYAALLDVVPSGTRPARGLLWPDPADPASPASTFLGTRVIEREAVVHIAGKPTPSFHPEHTTLFVPGRVVALRASLADGSVRDLTRTNERGSAFLPFGERAGPRDVLSLTFRTHADEGLFPHRRPGADALWALGVRVADDESPREIGEDELCAIVPEGAIAVRALVDDRRVTLPVVADSSAGLLRSGALVLDVSSIPGSPHELTLELRLPHGLPRAPRVLRIVPNVLPITQRAEITDEAHEVAAGPNWAFPLAVAGLCFAAGDEPLRLAVHGAGAPTEWRRCERLDDAGPRDRVYELDETRSRVRFGNGINGARPEVGATVLVSYSVSAGEHGNVARNRAWTVAGIDGTFGRNPEPIVGGSGSSDLLGMRRAARRNLRAQHALVTEQDIVAAARALPLLGVARAWLVEQAETLQTGEVRLAAVREPTAAAEPERAPETSRWLEAVRRALAARMPLATRLVVIAPGYVDFAVSAELESDAMCDPSDVERRARDALRARLALTGPPAGAAARAAQLRAGEAPRPRAQGVAVTRADVVAWLLEVAGVARVTRVELLQGREVRERIEVPKAALPRLDDAATSIVVATPSSGGVR